MDYTKANEVPIQRIHSSPTIDRRIAEEAYIEYAERFGRSQSFQRLHERGGFGENELIIFLFNRIERLQGKPITRF